MIAVDAAFPDYNSCSIVLPRPCLLTLAPRRTRSNMNIFSASMPETSMNRTESSAKRRYRHYLELMPTISTEIKGLESPSVLIRPIAHTKQKPLHELAWPAHQLACNALETTRQSGAPLLATPSMIDRRVSWHGFGTLSGASVASC